VFSLSSVNLQCGTKGNANTGRECAQTAKARQPFTYV
jgi:hypothetical protein